MSDKIVDCERCSAPIDTEEPGHYKSPDERFIHRVCYEGDGPEKVLDLSGEHPFKEQVPKTYNCGHYAEGPPLHLPRECPECGVKAP